VDLDPPAGPPPPCTGAARDVLEAGELEVVGRMPWSSNATFLVHARLDGREVRGVYKPRRGERPLWDFPLGVYAREVAAWHLSEALGWGVVPFTTIREGPLGVGSVQAFVDADFEQHYFTLVEHERHHADLQRIAVFDLLANNTDRKSGHCLVDGEGRVFAIDNALCFHHEPKLRTVIWDFAGDPIPDALVEDVARTFDDGVPPPLAHLLDPFERDALLTRARVVLRERAFPIDHTGRRWPWPLV
jgi:uncharacterized repeat protein (TIGR03843 family)